VRSRRRSAAVAAGVVLTASLLSSCATEVDPDVPTPATDGSTPTTEFVASGSTAELLDQLLAEASGLSEAIVVNEGQHDTIGRIDALWEAARPGVAEAVPDGLLEFERAIALLHNGVDRRRPADADKAYNNLVQLVAALP
jgi:hypothetical protein